MCRALSSSTAPAQVGVCSMSWLLQVTVQRCFKNPHPNPPSTARARCPTGPSTVVTTGLLISPVSKTERGAPHGQDRGLIRSSSLISSPSSQKGEGDNSQSPQLPAVQGAAVGLSVCRVAPPHLAGFVCSGSAQPSTPHPPWGARGTWWWWQPQGSQPGPLTCPALDALSSWGTAMGKGDYILHLINPPCLGRAKV